MNVYDFDETIFHPDSMTEFVLWYMKKHPGMLFRFGPKMLSAAVSHKRGRIPYYRLVLVFYSSLRYVRNLEEEIEKFWDIHEKNISAWYLAQK